MRRFPCARCGAELDYRPGTAVLECAFCGHQNPIAAPPGEVREEDFEAALVRLESRAETAERLTVKCEACAAETTLPSSVTAAECGFCGANIVATARARTMVRPGAVLPFAVPRGKAREAFAAWLSRLWFAPSRLRREALSEGRFTGVYVPYWTFDARTSSSYRGQRGDDYWVTETYTATENGKSVTRTRQVKHTRWTSVSGRVSNSFDDILVLASRSLPPDKTAKLEPWDLEALVPYEDAYLSGFRAESYAVDLREGFGVAREVMEEEIRRTVCQDIGGDHQRIDSVKTRYEDITYKHLLLPVWTSAYRYRGRVYRFLVNGRTGEVQGERPWSALKIGILVLVLLAAAAAIWAVVGLSGR